MCKAPPVWPSNSRERRRIEGESLNKQMLKQSLVLQDSLTGFPCSSQFGGEEAGEEQENRGRWRAVSGWNSRRAGGLGAGGVSLREGQTRGVLFVLLRWLLAGDSGVRCRRRRRAECTGGGAAHARRAVVAEIELWHGVAVESFAAVGPRRGQRVHVLDPYWDALRRLGPRTRRIPAHRAMPGTAASWLASCLASYACWVMRQPTSRV